MLLAIDTSAGTSVAVVDRGILALHTEEDTRRHAEAIGDLITICLAEAGVAVADLSGVAVGMGPGPFTGLRVGIAAAQAFAFGAQKPVVRVVSHDAVAFGYYAQDAARPVAGALSGKVRDVDAPGAAGPGVPAQGAGADGRLGPLLVVTDARRREVYWSAYAGVDSVGIPRRVGEPRLARPEELPDAVPDYDGYLRLDTKWVSAASVGLLAEALYQHGRTFAGPTPLYLRPPDVTPSAGPKRVTR